MRMRIVLIGAVLIVPLVWAVTSCDGTGTTGAPRPTTPEGVIEAAVYHAEREDYEAIWNLYSGHYQEKWLKGILAQQEQVKRLRDTNDPNYPDQAKWLEAQLGERIDVILRMTPKEWALRNLKTNREQIVRCHVVGEPEVTGATAKVVVKTTEDRGEATYYLIQRGGQWLVNSVGILPGGREASEIELRPPTDPKSPPK